MAFEKYIIKDEDGPKMSLHLFVAILAEFLSGNKTAGEAKTAIEDHLGVTLSDNEVSDITGIISYINAGASGAEKRNNMDEVYRVLVLAENGVWYNTKALLKARLSWSE